MSSIEEQAVSASQDTRVKPTTIYHVQTDSSEQGKNDSWTNLDELREQRDPGPTGTEDNFKKIVNQSQTKNAAVVSQSVADQEEGMTITSASSTLSSEEHIPSESPRDQVPLDRIGKSIFQVKPEVEEISPERMEVLKQRESIEFKKVSKLKHFGIKDKNGKSSSAISLFHSLKKKVKKLPKFFQRKKPPPTQEEIDIRSEKFEIEGRPVKGILKRRIVEVTGSIPDPKYASEDDVSGSIDVGMKEISGDIQATSFSAILQPNATAPNSTNVSYNSLMSLDFSETEDSQSEGIGNVRSMSDYEVFATAQKFRGKKPKSLKFHPEVLVGETHHPQDYERQGDFIAKQLTPLLAMAIKDELNAFKSEMVVHDDSKRVMKALPGHSTATEL